MQAQRLTEHVPGIPVSGVGADKLFQILGRQATLFGDAGGDPGLGQQPLRGASNRQRLQDGHGLLGLRGVQRQLGGQQLYQFTADGVGLRQQGQTAQALARTLGRGPLRAFLVATWPTVRPAAIAGSLLVALYALSDFGLVAMMRYPTLTWGINAAYSASFDRAQAATLALLLVVLALVVVAGERAARRQVPRAAARAVA